MCIEDLKLHTVNASRSHIYRLLVNQKFLFSSVRYSICLLIFHVYVRTMLLGILYTESGMSVFLSCDMYFQ